MLELRAIVGCLRERDWFGVAVCFGALITRVINPPRKPSHAEIRQSQAAGAAAHRASREASSK